MKTIKIKYIGMRNDHEDHLYGTGLKWKPGQVHSVPLEAAERMLTHPDVYEDARSAKEKKAAPIKPNHHPLPRRDRDEKIDKELPMPRLNYMTKAQMAEYSQRFMGERLNPDKMTAHQMRMTIAGSVKTDSLRQ